MFVRLGKEEPVFRKGGPDEGKPDELPMSQRRMNFCASARAHMHIGKYKHICSSQDEH